MIGVYLYDIFGASAGNKSSHPIDGERKSENMKHALFCTKKHKLMRNNSIKKIISRCIMMLTRKYGGI